MESHRELWRAILGDEKTMLVDHGIAICGLVVSKIYSPGTVVGIRIRVVCTCVLRLWGEAMTEDTWQTVWRCAVKIVLSVGADVNTLSLELLTVVNSDKGVSLKHVQHLGK